MPSARKLVLALTLIGILSGVTAGASGAANICWSGGGGNSNWETAANWSGGVVPGAGDVASLSSFGGGGCNQANAVTINRSLSIGAITGGNMTITIASPARVTFTGTSPSQLGVPSVDVADGASIDIVRGARVDSAGGWNLHTTGAVTVEGVLASPFSGLQIQGGSLRIAAGAKLLATASATLGINNTYFDMQGTVDLTDPVLDGAGAFFFYPAAGSPTSAGTWIGNDRSRFVAQIVGGETYNITGPVSGTWSAQTSNTGNGPSILRFSGAGSCVLDELIAHPPGGLQADRDCTIARFGIFNSSYRYAGRSGTGTITAGTADIAGGGLYGPGLTRVTGATSIVGNSNAPDIYDGATLRTEGPTTWSGGGYLFLGAQNQTGPGTWENAGALTISNTGGIAGVIDYSPDFRSGGALKNLAGGSIVRTAPTGPFSLTARVENAGSIDVQQGVLGGAPPGPFLYGTLVQTGGTTRVASGATLDLDTTLNGGTLKGNGTVRSVANPGGTVAPGESPGALTITGAFTQGAGGTLLEDIAGLAPASFDRLLVSGAATLGGTVKIVKDPAYSPNAGDTYNILTAASRSGEFASLTGDSAGFAASYRADGATLTYGSGGGTPPPSGGGDTPSGGGTTTTPSGGGGTTTTTPSGDGSTTPPPVGGSGTTTRPPAATTPAPRNVDVASIATLPSAKRCVSRRDFTIRLRIPKGKRVTSAEVRVAGKKVAVLKGRRLTARVRLTGLPKGTFKVTITLTLAGGGQLQGTRTYHTCAPRKTA